MLVCFGGTRKMAPESREREREREDRNQTREGGESSPSRVVHAGQASPTLFALSVERAASRLARPFWPLYLPLWPFVPPSPPCSRTYRVPLPPSSSFFRSVASSSRLQPLKLHSLMRSTDPQTGSSITPGFLPLPPFALSYDIPVSFLPSNDCPLDFFLPLSSPFVPLFHRLGSLRFPLVFSLSLSLFFSPFPLAPDICVSFTYN